MPASNPAGRISQPSISRPSLLLKWTGSAAESATSSAQPRLASVRRRASAGLPTPGVFRSIAYNSAGWEGVEAVEPVRFKSKDGLEIEGWLMRPAGFEAGNRYPLLLNIHGGPHMYYG